MNESKKSFQETLDEGLDNFWKTLDGIINSTSQDPRQELDETIMRFEKRLKDGIKNNVTDPEKKESKIFQIEVMISDIRDNLDRVLEVKSPQGKDEKRLEISDKPKDSQLKLDEYPDKDLRSLKKKISSLGDE